MNIVSLIVVILAVLFALIPVYGHLVAVPLIIIGLILSVDARRKNKQNDKDERLAWGGFYSPQVRYLS